MDPYFVLSLMSNLGSGDVCLHLPKTGPFKLKTMVMTGHKEGTLRASCVHGQCTACITECSRTRGNYYRQMELGIKPASHGAINNLDTKTTNGLSYGHSHHSGVGKQISIT